MNNYRQSTAKALMDSTLYADLYSINGKLYVKESVDLPKYPQYPLWNPLKDANHRDMVWEWMIKQGVKIFIEHWSSKGWNIDLRGEVGSMIISAKDTSLFTATEKAWEEYTNNK